MVGKGREDVGFACCFWEAREIDRARVGGLYGVTIGEINDDGFDGWLYIGTGGRCH
jgi:hypothetical protein